MSEPKRLPRSVTETAVRSTEESVKEERQVVGDQPAEGSLVDEQRTQ
jgi:hypothetical protein